MKIEIIYDNKTKEKEEFIELIKNNIKDKQKIKSVKFIEKDIIEYNKKSDLYIIFADDDNLFKNLKDNNNKENTIIITSTIKVEYVKTLLNYSYLLLYIKSNKDIIIYQIINKVHKINKMNKGKTNAKTINNE